MWTQLFLEQLHFGINLIAALVVFAIAWLYFDAWLAKKTARLTCYVSGFILLSLSFLIHAAIVELPTISAPLFNNDILFALFGIFRTIGYLFIISGLIMDPIQNRPDTQKSIYPALPITAAVIGLDLILPVPFAIAAGIIGFLYYRRATIGLEKHLLPVSYSFFILAVSEAFSLSSAFQNTTNVTIYNIVAPFGILWIFQHLILIASIVVLRKWLFGYLLKRFETQLFMIITSIVVGVYIITTITFTSLLLKNIQDEWLMQLSSNVHVLNYALETKKANLLSDAQLVAQDSAVIEAVTNTLSQASLRELTQQFLLSKKLTSLIVVNSDGRVLARGEDNQRFGDSLSGNSLFQTAQSGKEISSVVSQEGVLAPELLVKSAVGIKSNNRLIGAVIAGSIIDNAFLDGIKKETGLEATVYVSDTIAATTLIAADNETRPIGIREKNTIVKQNVLEKGVEYADSVTFLNRPFLGAYLPLTDQNTSTVGMLFIARGEDQILSTAARSIELTFLITIVLLVLSVIPAYIISRSITRQVR